MRKRYKKKQRSCKLCKPHKRGIKKRWKAREMEMLRLSDKNLEDYLRKEDA